MLSKRTRELLDLIVPSKIPVGKKLVIGDGAARLEADTLKFIKSMLGPTTAAAALTARGAVVRVSKVGGHVDLKRGFEKLAKRAPHTLITPEEMQGGTPRIAPTGKPRSEPGLSDEDIKVLEQEITTGWPALAPAQASKLFLQSFRVITANPSRRLTTESDAYGIAPAPGAGR